MVHPINDVDICVTCISDKPPQLPLRQELISLGVEVIYKAKGLGAKAVKKETHKALEGYREAYEARENRKMRIFPRSASRQRMKDRKKRRAEQELSVCKSLSYDDYLRYFDSRSVDSPSFLQQLGGNFPDLIQERREEVESMDDVVSEAVVACGVNRKIIRRYSRSESESSDSDGQELLPHFNSDSALATTYANLHSSDREQALQVMKSEEALEEAFAVFSSPSDSGAGFEGVLAALGSTTAIVRQNTNSRNNALDKNENLTDNDSDSDSSTVDTRKGKRKPQKITVSATGNRWWYEDRAKLAKVGSGKASDYPEEAATTAGEKLDENRDKDWMSSTIKSFAAGIYRATEQQNIARNPPPKEPRKRNRVVSNEVFSALESCEIQPTDIDQILEYDRDLIWTQLSSSGRTPLHVACDRGFPDRSSELNDDSTLFINALTEDIANCRTMLEVVVLADIDACLERDASSDLPVHLLARRLIKWEEWWKRRGGKVLDMAKTSKLYETMSKCIELVLRPIVTETRLSRSHGSIGIMLPLHIAAIFDVSLYNFKHLLDAYPEAAAIRCDMRALGANYRIITALPIELMERPRADKTNTADATSNTDDEWPSKIQPNLNDVSRRSDLLFAFNPNVLPFRQEALRLKRIEAMISGEAKCVVHESDNGEFSDAVKKIWIWMCTFEDSSDKGNTYVESVERIVDSLDPPSIKKLAVVGTEGGRILIDAATPQCRKVIRDGIMTTAKLSQLSEPEKNQNQLVTTSPSSCHANDKVNLGVICKTIFNVREDAFPTNFIILPYKLINGPNGTLALEDPNSAPVAVKFAESLLKMTQPCIVRHILEKKLVEHLDHRISPKNVKEWAAQEEKSKGLELILLSLYGTQNGYFYFLDEISGLPVIHGTTDSRKIYPIELKQPIEVVQRLLPLMLMGMLMMRGEKSLSTLAHTLTIGSNFDPPSFWIQGAEDIMRFMYTRGGNRENSLDLTHLEMESLRKMLVAYVSRLSSFDTPRRAESKDGCEWVVELSFLKILIDRYDAFKTFGGLESLSFGSERAIWSFEKGKQTQGEGEEPPEKVSAKNRKLMQCKQIADDMSSISGRASLFSIPEEYNSDDSEDESVDEAKDKKSALNEVRTSYLPDTLAIQPVDRHCLNSTALLADYSSAKDLPTTLTVQSGWSSEVSAVTTPLSDSECDPSLRDRYSDELKVVTLRSVCEGDQFDESFESSGANITELCASTETGLSTNDATVTYKAEGNVLVVNENQDDLKESLFAAVIDGLPVGAGKHDALNEIIARDDISTKERQELKKVNASLANYLESCRHEEGLQPRGPIAAKLTKAAPEQTPNPIHSAGTNPVESYEQWRNNDRGECPRANIGKKSPAWMRLPQPTPESTTRVPRNIIPRGKDPDSVSEVTTPTNVASTKHSVSVSGSSTLTKFSSVRWKQVGNPSDTNSIEKTNIYSNSINTSNEDSYPLQKYLEGQEVHLHKLRSKLGRDTYDTDDETTVTDESTEGSTRGLMIRLCNLEETLLTREIDLQQLKLDIHSFELRSVASELMMDYETRECEVLHQTWEQEEITRENLRI